MSYSKYDLCCVMQRRAVNWYGTSIVLYCITSHISVVKSNEDETSNKEERETKIEDRYRCQPLPRYAIRHYDVTTSQLGILIGLLVAIRQQKGYFL